MAASPSGVGRSESCEAVVAVMQSSATLRVEGDGVERALLLGGRVRVEGEVVEDGVELGQGPTVGV